MSGRVQQPAHSAADGAGRSRRVTLDDVAAKASVSRAMVSIVMRQAPGATESTRERVIWAAEELGYRPDARARSLAGQRTRQIGVLFGVVGTFHLSLLEGLYEAAEKQRHGLLLGALTSRRGEAEAVRSLQDFSFDGLVMLGPATAQPVLGGTAPVVVVGWHVEHPDVDVVRTSDGIGMTLAVDHLADLGHRRIAHIDGGPSQVAVARRDAFLHAMRIRGLQASASVVSGGEDQLAGYRATRVLLEQPGELPTAILAFNDDVAVASIGVLTQAGVDVPGDVSVIGWDDLEVAGSASVGLTSVAQQPHEMARRAIERIIARCDGRDITEREIILEPVLSVRESTTTSRSS